MKNINVNGPVHGRGEIKLGETAIPREFEFSVRGCFGSELTFVANGNGEQKMNHIEFKLSESNAIKLAGAILNACLASTTIESRLLLRLILDSSNGKQNKNG